MIDTFQVLFSGLNFHTISQKGIQTIQLRMFSVETLLNNVFNMRSCRGRAV